MTRPRRNELPSPQVREFRELLANALNAEDEQGRRVADSKWGVYAFYDYDGEPIYVGQTNEQLRTRIRRHLTNQRTDAVAMRILDPFEVAEVEMWPLWELSGRGGKDPEAKALLDAAEYTAYVQAVETSRYRAILNEQIPPVSARFELPPSHRHDLRGTIGIDERTHPDVRIARRAETIARLAAVARERGEVTEGLRRVLVIQGIRLTYISAVRLAESEGRPAPDPLAIDARALVGSLLAEPWGSTTEEELEEEQVEER